MSKHPDNSDLMPATLEVGGCRFLVRVTAYYTSPEDHAAGIVAEYTKRDALRLIRKLVKEVERIEAEDA